jgi:CHAT domain-containing protein
MTSSAARPRHAIWPFALFCGAVATLVVLTAGGRPMSAMPIETKVHRAAPIKVQEPSDTPLARSLAALKEKIDANKPAEAAPLAVQALQAAIQAKDTHWILPLAAAIPSLYAQANDLADAEVYYHSLIRALLFGDITGPDNELDREVRFMTAAFVEHGRAADAIASVDKLVASLKTSEKSRNEAGAFLFHAQAQQFQQYILYDYSIQSIQKALDLAKKSYAPDSPAMATLLNDVGYDYLAATRFQEAEEPLKESLRIREQSDPDNLVEIGTTCQNLTTVFIVLNDLTDAEQYVNRALAARKQALGVKNLKYLESKHTLATVLELKHQSKQAIAILEEARVGYHDAKDAIGEAGMMARLAGFYADEGDVAKSEQLAIEAVKLLDGASDDADSVVILSNLLEWRIGQELARGDVAGADADAEKVLATIKGRVAPDHNLMLASLGAAMRVDLAKGDSDHLLEHGQKLLAGMESQFSQMLNQSGSNPQPFYFNGPFDVFLRAAATVKGREVFSFDRTLQVVQWLELGSGSLALRQMAARASAARPELEAQVRDVQDLDNRSRAIDARLSGLEGAPESQRDEASIAVLRGDLQNIQRELTARQAAIKQAFPEYASLVSAAPLGTVALQALLHGNEAVVKFYVPDKPDVDSKAFVWVVTKDAKAWAELSLPPQEISDLVAALRCGLDFAAWDDQGSARCEKLLNVADANVPGSGDPLPFDLQRAFKLYRGLFAPVEGLIADKDLIIVPSGPLTQLPFHVLVTAEAKPPNDGDAGAGGGAEKWRSAAWLARTHAISILPSIASLQALRASAGPSRADKPFIGFGDPLLDGQQNDPKLGAYYKELAARARDRQACPATDKVQTVLVEHHETGSVGSIYRGRQADVDELREWSPLPETVDEVCEVGRQLGASADDIYLGSRATEGKLKDLSENGTLKRYATVHFATHGALSGDVKGTAEPGLILTPPPSGTTDLAKLARDDGFLSASEIATLSLDANMVVMAACNTAGDSDETSESLSGIARAFFYAGARSLLVSHWEVYSEATVKLMTNMAEATAVGRAEALRQSMLAMIDHGTEAEAHPAYWAPFTLIGEGAK